MELTINFWPDKGRPGGLVTEWMVVELGGKRLVRTALASSQEEKERIAKEWGYEADPYTGICKKIKCEPTPQG